MPPPWGGRRRGGPAGRSALGRGAGCVCGWPPPQEGRRGGGPAGRSALGCGAGCVCGWLPSSGSAPIVTVHSQPRPAAPTSHYCIWCKQIRAFQRADTGLQRCGLTSCDPNYQGFVILATPPQRKGEGKPKSMPLSPPTPTPPPPHTMGWVPPGTWPPSPVPTFFSYEARPKEKRGWEHSCQWGPKKL